MLTKEDRITLKNGIKIFPFRDEEELLEYVVAQPSMLVSTNAEIIQLATPETKKIINDNVGYCDGEGAVRALKRHGAKHVNRIPGCELWLNLVRRKWKSGTSFYLVGTTQEIIEDTVKNLKEDFPGINIVNYRNGFLKSDEERQALLADVAEKQPEVVFVAMGFPKQELLMAEMQKVNPRAIYLGLGGSFNVYTGHTARAPQWWQDHGLEFAYRLIFEKSRRGRYINYLRYFISLYTGKI